MSQSTYYDAAGYPNFAGGMKTERLFTPDELNALQGVFNDCVKECGFSRDGKTAEALGSAVIRLYSQGQRDPKFIKATIVPSFKRRS